VKWEVSCSIAHEEEEEACFWNMYNWGRMARDSMYMETHQAVSVRKLSFKVGWRN